MADLRPADDDRVVPLHSFKHAATLQHLKAGNPHPLIIRIDKKAGHGAGKSTEKRCVSPRSLVPIPHGLLRSHLYAAR